MGLRKSPETCFLTGFPTTDIPSAIDAIEYYVDIYGKRYYCLFRWNHQNSRYVEQNKHIILGLFANEKFPVPEPKPFYDNDKLEKIINEAIYPRDPKSKMDNLLLQLSRLQSFDGDQIVIANFGSLELFVTKLFFKNYNEYIFYMRTLKDHGFLNFTDNVTKTSIDFSNIHITFSGLSYLIEIQNKGSNSKNCFIAMSFSETENEIRAAIKQSCYETGFNPILVDELQIPSDETINDAIISNLKMSKFIIADFTKQKHGVYFEAGYGLGYGIPVIYTCSNDDFKNSHFDTNHYPHIIYNSCSELIELLKNKIIAWIL